MNSQNNSPAKKSQIDPLNPINSQGNNPISPSSTNAPTNNLSDQSFKIENQIQNATEQMAGPEIKSPINNNLNPELSNGKKDITPRNESLSKKKILAILVILFILVGLVSTLIYIKSKDKKSNTTTNAINSAAISTAAKIGNVAIDYVTISTNLNESIRKPKYISDTGGYYDYNLSEVPGQAYIGNIAPGACSPAAPKVIDDTASVSNGHYVYIDTSSAKPSNWVKDTINLLGGTVTYDGKIVYQGSDVLPYSEAISKNGLHYAYVRVNNNNGQPSIYIDNRLSQLKYSMLFPIFAVSDDGTKIAYDTTDTYQNDAVYVNNTHVATIYCIGNTVFSSDLSHNIVNGLYPQVSQPEDPFYDLLIDGKSVNATDSVHTLGAQLAMSKNGISTAYIVESNAPSTLLYINNRNLGNINDPINLSINDAGNYSYVDLRDALLFINKTSYPLNSKYVNDNNSNNVISAISDDGNHYFVANPISNYYTVDGKAISLSGNIFNADFVGNTLYVYKFSN
jgi:hypothetical protein